MSWTTSADLHAQVQRLWDRGDLLRASVGDAIEWPVRLKLRGPSATDVMGRFDIVREWVDAVTATAHVRFEWRESKHRVHGSQRLPDAAWLDSLDDALAIVDRVSEAQRFRELWIQASTSQPAVLAWLSEHPLDALSLSDRWTRLLSVVSWVQANPRPAVYIRQVDLPGIDSKFIEAHRGVLADLLDAALPTGAIDTEARGVAAFARRYGFLEKPERMRFRLLDPSIECVPGSTGRADITLDAPSFATLALSVDRVFITENETNFLAFPDLPRAVVVFGAGYGLTTLARAPWLQRCRVQYWGDLDTHGFAILDQLRHALPHAESFLMDRETLLAHRASWGEEPEQVRHELRHLTADDAAVYDDLRYDRLQRSLRLEQERIAFRCVRARLEV